MRVALSPRTVSNAFARALISLGLMGVRADKNIVMTDEWVIGVWRKWLPKKQTVQQALDGLHGRPRRAVIRALEPTVERAVVHMFFDEWAQLVSENHELRTAVHGPQRREGG